MVSADTIGSAVGMAAMRRWPAEALLQRLHLGPHGARIGDDGARPFEDPLALGGEAQEPRRPLDEHDAQRVLELLDAGREGRLRHAAGFGGAAEVSSLASARVSSCLTLRDSIAQASPKG